MTTCFWNSDRSKIDHANVPHAGTSKHALSSPLGPPRKASSVLSLPYRTPGHTQHKIAWRDDTLSSFAASIRAGLARQLRQGIRELAMTKFDKTPSDKEQKHAERGEEREASKQVRPGLATGPVRKRGWQMPLPRFPNDHRPGLERK